MSLFTSHTHPPVFESHDRAEDRPRRLVLERTAPGWGLRDPLGQVIFEADGADARRRCLEQANTLGVLRLTFAEQTTA